MFSSISSGYDFSLVVKNDHTLWAGGSNLNGEFGKCITTGSFSFIQIMSDVTKAFAGNYLLVIKTDGRLWAAGADFYGQLGDTTNTIQVTSFKRIMNNVQDVSSSLLHSVVLKTDGTVWATGNNSSSQFGDNTIINSNVFKQVASGVASIETGGVYTSIIKTDGTLWVTGENRLAYTEMERLHQVRNLYKWHQM